MHFIIRSAKPSAIGETLFDSKTHVLHGVVHVNGFGHLMRINGLEGGSEILRGGQVMALWDALCHLMRVRDVTVEDVSNKKGMLLRVLMPIANKSTFYMQHGYRFGLGQFNVREADWTDAVQKLHETKLTDLLMDFDNVDETVQKIILLYSRGWETEMQTLGELLERMFSMAQDESAALKFAQQLQDHPPLNAADLGAVLSKIKREMDPPTANGICVKESESEDEAPPISQAMPPASPQVIPTPVQSPRVMEVESDHETESQTLQTPLDGLGELLTKPSRKAKKKVPIEDPEDLVKPRIAPFNAASLFEGSRKYSATKMIEIIRITLGVLQVGDFIFQFQF